jgi:hypothetical protein
MHIKVGSGYHERSRQNQKVAYTFASKGYYEGLHLEVYIMSPDQIDVNEIAGHAAADLIESFFQILALSQQIRSKN